MARNPLKAVRNGVMELYFYVEPIGAEHSYDELEQKYNDTRLISEYVPK